MKEFLAMGGYALYVWCSFGLTFVVMAAIVYMSGYQRRRAIAIVKRTAQIELRRTQQPNTESQLSESLQ